MALRLRRGTDAERQLITPVEGELVYTTDTKSVYIGDGVTAGGIIISGEIGLGDLPEVDLSTPPTLGQTLVWDGSKFVPSTVAGVGPEVLSIFDLSDVFTVTPPYPGDLLIYDGLNFVPDRIRNIFGDDSSLILNTANNTFSGNFNGSLLGDVKGSIFGDDSTLIIDSINNVLSVDSANINSLSYGGSFGLTLNSSETDEVEIRIFRRTPLPDTLAQVGVLYFDSVLNDNVESTTAYIQSLGSQNLGDPYAKSFLELNVIDETGTVSENNVLVLSWDGKAGFGTYDPTERLDVRGNGIFTGTVTAASFKGSIVTDDSTTFVDAINGTISASGFIQFGSYTDTEIAEITPSNGMVYYNTTDNRFRGFQNGSWINLDDGTSA